MFVFVALLNYVTKFAHLQMWLSDISRIIMLDYPFTEIRLSQRHSQPDLHLPMGKIGQASFLYSIVSIFYLSIESVA